MGGLFPNLSFNLFAVTKLLLDKYTMIGPQQEIILEKEMWIRF